MESPDIARPEIAEARRIVLKVGTAVLTHDDGRIALTRLFGVVESAAALRTQNREVLIVSSGAVGLGRGALQLDGAPQDLEERQACAAVGQTRLMGLYQEGFSRLGLVSGQVLLTQGDFEDRVRYLNLRGTLMTLLRRGVIPVINENDAVSTEELAFIEGARRPTFGDNDRLSALVATKLGADLLVLLTDVDGLFDRDPRQHPDARLLSTVVDPMDATAFTSSSGSQMGRGGMRSKVEAATMAARAGCHAVVASGLDPGNLGAVLSGHPTGSWFPARGDLGARRRWIAFAAAPRGMLHLDAGAVEALRHRRASLLAKGVDQVDGDFEPGDVVELIGPDGATVGRGMVYCDATTARDWCRGAAPEGVRNHDALVNRSHMVLGG